MSAAFRYFFLSTCSIFFLCFFFSCWNKARAGFELQGTDNGRVCVQQHVLVKNELDLFTLHAEPWPPGFSVFSCNDCVPLWNVEHFLSSDEGKRTIKHTFTSNMHKIVKIVSIHELRGTFALAYGQMDTISQVSGSSIGPRFQVCLPVPWSIIEFIDHIVWQVVLLVLPLSYWSEKIPL